MFDTFEGNMEGCYLYSRHSSPVIYILTNTSCYGRTETANVAASGWVAITLLYYNFVVLAIILFRAITIWLELTRS
jgi:hypothetical protein